MHQQLTGSTRPAIIPRPPVETAAMRAFPEHVGAPATQEVRG